MRVARGEKALPEDGKVDAVECRLSGGGGAGRFGRVRVCGTTGAAEKGQSGKTYGNKNRKGKQRKRKCQEVKNCVGVILPTCGSHRLLIFLFIALIEVVQVADICGFDAHQAGKTLHVFITEEQEKHAPQPHYQPHQ